jgi:glycosyltransferase involved in cell wall biosynthesis
MTVRLSVAIITLNEEHNLADCLASVSFADEIVVVDGGSSDGTCEIARAAGARVITHTEWAGFGPQKNLAIDACAGDWILSIDADERVPAALRDEIGATLRNPAFDVYEMPRRSHYCGRFMQHSGWWPDYVRRLFRRGAARFSSAPVHESLHTDRTTGRLQNPLEHWSFRTMEQVLDKVNRYSSLSAPIVVARGGRLSVGTALLHGAAAFFRTYVLKRGFLDGSHGLMLAISNAEGSYYRYIKAMLLAQQKQQRNQAREKS